jgi:hypothetical protein
MTEELDQPEAVDQSAETPEVPPTPPKSGLLSRLGRSKTARRAAVLVAGATLASGVASEVKGDSTTTRPTPIEQTTDEQTLFENRNPIARLLPHVDAQAGYKIGIGVTLHPDKADPFKEAVYINYVDQHSLDAAYAWIQSQGFKLDDLEFAPPRQVAQIA